MDIDAGPAERAFTTGSHGSRELFDIRRVLAVWRGARSVEEKPYRRETRRARACRRAISATAILDWPCARRP